MIKKQLLVYDNGQTFYTEGGMTIAPHGATLTKTINITHATEEEKQSLEKNPNQQSLIDTIVKRG